MIYTHENCYPECESNLDGVKASNVVSVDAGANTITFYEHPLKVVNGEFAKFIMSFDSVDIEYHPTLVCPHDLERLPTKFTFHGLRRIEK